MYIPLYVHATKKYIEISVVDQLGAMAKYILLAIIMAALIFPMNQLAVNDVIKLFAQVVIGVIVYVIMLIITKDKVFYEVLKKVIIRRKKK